MNSKINNFYLKKLIIIIAAFLFYVCTIKVLKWIKIFYENNDYSILKNEIDLIEASLAG